MQKSKSKISFSKDLIYADRQKKKSEKGGQKQRSKKLSISFKSEQQAQPVQHPAKEYIGDWGETLI